jgi:hypothetical protein
MLASRLAAATGCRWRGRSVSKILVWKSCFISLFALGASTTSKMIPFKTAKTGLGRFRYWLSNGYPIP